MDSGRGVQRGINSLFLPNVSTFLLGHCALHVKAPAADENLAKLVIEPRDISTGINNKTAFLSMSTYKHKLFRETSFWCCDTVCVRLGCDISRYRGTGFLDRVSMHLNTLILISGMWHSIPNHKKGGRPLPSEDRLSSERCDAIYFVRLLRGGAVSRTENKSRMSRLFGEHSC